MPVRVPVSSTRRAPGPWLIRAGRARTCCKGVVRRYRRQRKARNTNDFSCAFRLDPIPWSSRRGPSRRWWRVRPRCAGPACPSRRGERRSAAGGRPARGGGVGRQQTTEGRGVRPKVRPEGRVEGLDVRDAAGDGDLRDAVAGPAQVPGLPSQADAGEVLREGHADLLRVRPGTGNGGVPRQAIQGDAFVEGGVDAGHGPAQRPMALDRRRRPGAPGRGHIDGAVRQPTPATRARRRPTFRDVICRTCRIEGRGALQSCRKRSSMNLIEVALTTICCGCQRGWYLHDVLHECGSVVGFGTSVVAPGTRPGGRSGAYRRHDGVGTR